MANIIIFFTDGNATAGITDTPGILDHISTLKTIYEVEGLNIFTFGIGNDVNQQLLASIASQNNGIVEFLENNELQEVISHFYLTIQNPVLLDVQMEFDPPVIIETYPKELPNLFKGQQLIIAGRYQEAVPVEVTFSGHAYGNPISYNYILNLEDTQVSELQFLPRLWAKKKIEYLQNEYYLAGTNSNQADIIQDDIINTSLCYGVLSSFTSFEDNTGITSVEEIEEPTIDGLSLKNYPNPFTDYTIFEFQVEEDIYDTIIINIYDISGKLIYQKELFIGAAGQYEFRWDGTDLSFFEVPTGMYVFKVQVGEQVLDGKLIKY